MSLRFKMLGSILLATLVAWGLAAFLSYQDTQAEVDRLFDAHLTESARAILRQAEHEQREMVARGLDDERKHRKKDEDDDDNDDDDDDEHGVAELKMRGGLFEKRLLFQVWDDENELIVSSGKRLQGQLVPDGFSYTSGEGTMLRTFAERSGTEGLRVVVAESVEARRQLAKASVAHVLEPIVWMIVPLMILLILAVETTLRPVRRLSLEVGRRSPDDLTPIAQDGTPKELRPTISALNALFARLTRALEKERRFTADAAHELRTPLAAIRVQTEVAMRETDETRRGKALVSAIKGVDRATHLVAQMLTLARLDPETSVPQETVALRSIALGVLQAIAPEALAKSVDIELIEGSEEGLVKGSRAMLEILVRNLIDNAVRYTPPGGTVRATIAQAEDGMTFLVEDTGPGLTSDQKRSIGERFSRLSRPSGEGSGLGLSIVQRIAELHRARLRFEDRTSGSGLLVRVVFPKVN